MALMQLDPYTYIYNTPVFSTNGATRLRTALSEKLLISDYIGATPVYYTDQHQTDVIHAKA